MNSTVELTPSAQTAPEKQLECNLKLLGVVCEPSERHSCSVEINGMCNDDLKAGLVRLANKISVDFELVQSVSVNCTKKNEGFLLKASFTGVEKNHDETMSETLTKHLIRSLKARNVK